MKTMVPNYYKDFKCTASKCTDTCCAGWEIIIDAETYNHYKKVCGKFGERLKSNLTLYEDGEPGFVLQNHNCPFLNKNNLCDIYTELGEDCLCYTCKTYPRFIEEYGNLSEIGISLSCPEAARLILLDSKPVTFEVSEDDEISPVFNTDLVGRHTVGTGSSPQAVITSLITMPLDKGGLKITDISKYSVEMQNPDITKPAGAGDVPEANYKMIAALGVKRGDLEKSSLPTFGKEHGMPGFAPTQGHIPSGVPFIGFAIDEMKENKLDKVMIVGKGSLFLGRMTNQFDGVSFVMEKNDGKGEDKAPQVDEQQIKSMIADAMRKLAENLGQ